MSAFSAAKFMVACVTPSSFLSAFSMLRAQFMQLMPPMFRTSFLLLVWLIGLPLAIAGYWVSAEI
jgi:hypothetical protein